MKKFFQLFLTHFICIAFFSNVFKIYVASQFPGVGSPVWALFMGLLFDFVLAIYTFAPFAIFIAARGILQKPVGRNAIFVLLFCDFFFASFHFICEFFFFDEIHDRFNFIAVDYLIYTGEVLKNIWESYPVIPIVGALILLSGAVAFFLSSRISLGKISRANSLLSFAVYIICFSLSLFLTERDYLARASSYEQTVAKTGLFSLFAAYRNNEISFDRFYTNMDSEEASRIVHERLRFGYSTPKTSKEATSIIRQINASGEEKKLNVVLVLMESMSARFMAAYGNTQNISPNLDRIAKDGLFFANIYATGTRTVRGIEATTLSIPPTPGQSIVRRPGGTGIYNIGSVFRERNYHTSFLYGGYSLFDNMGGYFKGNGFDIYDQATYPKSEIGFSNAWGVADEFLFEQAIKVADQDFAQGKKFFQYILNTSNHRPFTYPEGRIDIPSHTNREGAVKYSDFAIGKFLEDAKKKPWFKDTLFIFVADHNASVAGGTDILPSDFLIPMIFYAPAQLKAQKISHFGSQIDLIPTLLGLLNFSYQSRFFGDDLMRANPERAFLGTYQMISLFNKEGLNILSPVQKWRVFDASPRPKLISEEKKSMVNKDDSKALQETVAFFKMAADWFSSGKLSESKTYPRVNERNY